MCVCTCVSETPSERTQAAVSLSLRRFSLMLSFVLCRLICTPYTTLVAVMLCFCLMPGCIFFFFLSGLVCRAKLHRAKFRGCLRVCLRRFCRSCTSLFVVFRCFLSAFLICLFSYRHHGYLRASTVCLPREGLYI